MLTWNDIAVKIATMTAEQRNKPALTQDTNTGEYCAFEEISQVDTDREEWKDHFELRQSNEGYDPVLEEDGW